ncbi:hypothetical protein PR048_006559 [Dryococelus australis]|uniref:Uncharacterized protein n=1 Tax=Dryococelus australis TaxID=614101 RepID=A0ABQ9IBB0_9NEOP|nr:hypothetical protein PR048_006559 [Dryococelus australis]
MTDYNRQLVQYILQKMGCGDNTSALKWNILQAMHRLCLAWSRLKPSTIANCFTKAGFPAGTDENDFKIMKQMSANLNGLNGESSHCDFASVDNQLATCSPESDDIPVEENIQVNNGSGDEEACSALDVLKRFFMTSTNLSYHMAVLQSMERDVAREIGAAKKQ